MKATREALEEQLKRHESDLRGLSSYIRQLKETTAASDTPSEAFQDDLTEAEYNASFHEDAIARLKEAIAREPESMAYWVYKDTGGEWRWQLRAGNNRIVATSGESYHSKQDCLHGITLVKGATNAPVKDKQ